MQLNEAVKETISILSEINCGNMTPIVEEAWKAAIKILEDGLRESTQEPVAIVKVLEAGGNAGIATRIVEIDDPMRERLQPGTKLYAASQPTENLRCKSTQKRLATLWGYEKARQPLTEDQLRDALLQCPQDTVENLRVRWLYAKDFAR